MHTHVSRVCNVMGIKNVDDLFSRKKYLMHILEIIADSMNIEYYII